MYLILNNYNYQWEIGRVGWSVLESRNGRAHIQMIITKYEGHSKFLYVDFKLNNVIWQFLMQ